MRKGKVQVHFGGGFLILQKISTERTWWQSYGVGVVCTWRINAVRVFRGMVVSQELL